jgi:hypothetical protein
MNKKLIGFTSLMLISLSMVLSMSACGTQEGTEEILKGEKNLAYETSQSAVTLKEVESSAGALDVSAVETTAGAVNATKADNIDVTKEESTKALDKYLTEATPEGQPVPVEPQETQVDKKKVYYCTLSISCNTILDNMDKLDAEKVELVPMDGMILPATTIEFYEGESVFEALYRATKNDKIHFEYVNTPVYNSAYIEGINNLYEFDCGELSGWMYKVNDWFPNYGCSRYQLKDGDVIEWLYTCDLGRDVGGEYSTGGE